MPAKKAKAKKDKLSAEENAKLVQARLSQLEQEKTTEKTAQAEVDREVKKATRDLNELIKSVKDPLSRIDLLQQKYEELLSDMKKLEREYAKTKKKSDQQQKDSDKAKTEHNKTATMKDKLEKLCRELTKENKKVKDENKRLEESEKAANVTVNERLDEMLYDVQEVMNQKGTVPVENLHLELDELFKTRCKVLADQAEVREMQFKTILRHKDAEIGHLAAKHEVERRRADAEAARCRTLTNQVSTFSHTEAELRSQLNIYVEKFKQVEDTLNNSNELFLTFRKEMEEMSKKTKRLEKENLTLTRKHDQTNRNILEMAEERTRDKEDLERLRKQEQQMRSIIKTMQEQVLLIMSSSSPVPLLTTPLCTLLGIKHPIMLAGMARTSGGPLAAAVSNAGGIGTIGGLGYTPEQLQEIIDELKSNLTDKSLPFGVDLALPQVGGSARKTNHDYTHGQLDQLTEVIIKNGAKIFISAVGVPPAHTIKRLHEAGILVMNMVGAPKHAEKALRAGVDILCAQGGEGGGHTGDIANSILIPAIVDVAKKYKSPLTGQPALVVAAGGINDGRSLASSLMQGAAGVWVGTRFVASTEAGCSDQHKQAVVEAGFNDTVRTLVLSGRPLRAKVNDYIARWEAQPEKIKELTDKGIVPIMDDIENEVEDVEMPYLMGQVCGVINDIKPAREIVEDMIRQAVEAINRGRSYVEVRSRL
ncbi:hypothetical protein DV736_g1172, partial [Chaetothyriales sp. CBS 134916]